MPNALQLYLSPRPLRSCTNHLAEVKGIYNACHAWFKTENGIDYLYEEHYTSSHPKVQGGLKSQSGPPPHIHLHQNEYFTCVEGVLGVVCDGKTTLIKPGDEEVCVPAGSRHRFWAHEGGGKSGNMICRVRIDPYPGGFDKQFIWNIFSYMSDCETHGVPLSGLQLMLFLYSHDILLDMPLPIPLLRALHWLIAYVIGCWLLGYRSTYSEYYDDGNGGQPEVKKEL